MARPAPTKPTAALGSPLGAPLGAPGAPGALDPADTLARIKDVIVREMFVEGLSVEDIEDDHVVFGEGDGLNGLGLDSIDALQLVLGLEQEFGVRIDTNTLDHERLATVSGMAEFVHELKSGAPEGAAKLRGHR